jgi:hypothetical protein
MTGFTQIGLKEEVHRHALGAIATIFAVKTVGNTI